MLNWQKTSLENICSRITDGAHLSPKSVDSGKPMASVKDLTPFGITLGTCRHISEEDFQKLIRQGCKPEVGDVLIAKDGASALDTVCEVKTPIDVVLLSSVAILRPDPKKVLPSFLRLYLDCDSIRKYMKNSFTSGAAIPRVVLKDFKRVEINLPPLETQRKIASILSAYDDLIENNTRRIKTLEEMAQAIYREWFVNFRFPGHEQVKMVDSPLGRVPEGWEVVKLADVAKVNDRSIRTANAPETINYIDISSVSTGSIDKVERVPFAEAPSRARRIVQHGDVIWSTVRPNRKSFSLILVPPADLVVSTGFAVISPKCVPYTYLYQALTTDEFVGYLVNHATGAAYPAVNAGDFEKAGFLKPTAALLDAYHEATEGMFLLRHRLITKNQNLRQTRDLLLPKLISGEVEVSELDIDIKGAA